MIEAEDTLIPISSAEKIEIARYEDDEWVAARFENDDIEMADACFDYFSSLNNNFEHIVREVPFLSRCIDMVLITRENQCITIEFKINNWRKALEQTKNHKLGADKSYICLPEKTFNVELMNLLKQEQIGLFLYNPSAPLIIYESYPAPLNEKKVIVFNNMLLHTALNISNYTN